MPIDPTVDVVNQMLQGGADLEIGGVLNIDTINGGIFKVADQAQPQKATITPAAGTPGSNISLVSIQVQDGGGNNLAFPTNMDVFLSDSAAGVGLTATAASGAVAAGASGTDFGDYLAKKAKYVQTTAAGLYILSITDVAKTGFYVCVNLPGQAKPIVSAQLIAANYG